MKLVLILYLISSSLLHADSGSSSSYFLTLRHDDLDNSLSVTEIEDFKQASSVIRTANLSPSFRKFHPIPQPLDAFQIISWLQEKDIGAAIIPAPLFVLLHQANLIQNFHLEAFIPPTKTYWVTRQPKEKTCDFFNFKPTDVVLFKNEYHNKGSLLQQSMLQKYPSLALAETYYFQDDRDQLSFFQQSPSRIFGVFSKDELIHFKNRPDICILPENINSDLSGNFLIVNNAIELPKESLKNLNEATLNGSKIKEKVQNLLNYYKQLSPLPKLTYKNILQRLNDEIKNNYFAVTFMGGGARSTYLFRFSNEFFNHILEKSETHSNVVLVGSSGGALSALMISLLKPNVLVSGESIAKLTDLTGYIRPTFRSKITAFLIQHQLISILLLFVIILCFAISLSHIILTKKTLNVYLKIVFFALFILCSWSIPEISIEYAISFLLLNFIAWVLAHTFFTKYTHKLGYNIFSSMIFILLLVSIVKFPFHAENIFESYDSEQAVRDLLTSVGDTECNQYSKRGEFSKCVYQKIRYPLSMNGTSIGPKSAKPINFYIRPKNSSFPFPLRDDWVDLSLCPEHLLDVVEGSTAIPTIFHSVTFKCRGRKYKLVDGTAISPFPAVPDSVHYRFLFWNSLIDTDNGFIKKAHKIGQLTLFKDFIMYWNFRQEYLQQQALQQDFRQTFFITVPSSDLIGSADFWGAYLNNGSFTLPADLVPMASKDFFSKPGVFSELSNGEPEPDEFWRHFKKWL